MKKSNKATASGFPKKTAGLPARVRIHKLPTGVRGLDDIVGGGIPEFSFNIIAGAPGSGKTTLAHQIAFANATPKKTALYFTVIGEPVLKMLRYQQQYSFFDESRLGTDIRFVSLSDVVLEQDLNAVLEEIIKQVTAINPAIVVVDSFRTIMRKAVPKAGEAEMQSFIHRLAQFLTGWEATTFLVGEYAEDEIRNNSLFTMVDGIFWLSQVTERNSVVRKLQIVKLRGQASVPGLHTIRIGDGGLQAFSRTLGLTGTKRNRRGDGNCPSAFPSWTGCWAGAFSKATASSWPGRRERANRLWRRSLSPKDCAGGSRESWRFSRSVRRITRNGPAISA